MGGIKMTIGNNKKLSLFYSRTAGYLYLVIIIAGIFAEFFVRSNLVVPGDSAATANNIVSSERLFRIGIACDLLMIISDIGLAIIFYVLLKSVNGPMALLASFFRLIQAAVLGVNLLNLFYVLQLLSGAEFVKTIGVDQLNSLSLIFLKAHGIGYSLGLVFFGIHLFILSLLFLKSGLIPKIISFLLIFASVGYLVDSFAKTLMLHYEKLENVFGIIVFAPAVIAELSLCLWLLVKGIKTDI
jgi:hypothetical protein